jgi:hypothetical protein
MAGVFLSSGNSLWTNSAFIGRAAVSLDPPGCLLTAHAARKCSIGLMKVYRRSWWSIGGVTLDPLPMGRWPD